MKLPPKISIIIPSFNAEQYIAETLDSILVQKYLNLEVIVEDGGSSDGTIKILKKYSKIFKSTLRWETKKDKGQVYAINSGLKKATGEIVAFINSDDVYEKGAFRRVASIYKNSPNTLWFAGRGRVIDKNGNEVSPYVTLYKNLLLRLNSYNMLLTVNYLMQPSIFLTRESVKKIKQFSSVDGIVMEYESWLQLGKISMPFVLDEYLSSFRMSGSNFSSTQTKKLLDRDEEVVKKYTKNIFIMVLHKLNNLGRYFVLQSLRS